MPSRCSPLSAKRADRFSAFLLGLALISAAGLFLPLLDLIVTRTVLTNSDLEWYHLPLRYLYANALRAGDSIAWTSNIFGGFFILGEGQGGPLHPLHLVLYRFLPLDVAFNLELTSSYVFGFAGTVVLARRLGLSAIASSVGAVLFTFSGFNLLHVMHLHAVAVIMHAPWMLAAIDGLVMETQGRAHVRAACALAALLGSQLLLGFPQFVLFTVLICAAFLLVRLSSVGKQAVKASVFAWITAAGLAGMAIGAAQLLPTLDILRESDRGHMDPGFALTYSLHPWNLVQLWSPYAFASRVFRATGETEAHEFGLYNGAFCSVALAWLLARRRDLGWRTGLAGGLILTAAFFLLVSFGQYGGLYLILVRVPPFDLFRAPARYIVLVQLCLALAGALALDDLIDIARRGGAVPGRRLWPLAIPTVLSAGTLGVALVAKTDFQWAAWPEMAWGLASIAGTTALIALTARGARWPLVLLIPWTAFDLAMWGWPNGWHPAPTSLRAVVAAIDAPSQALEGATLDNHWTPLAQVPVLRGFRMASGYVALNPRVMYSPESEATLRLSGVQWRHAADGWHAVPDTMPRARLVTEVRTSTNITRDRSAIDLSQTALVEESLTSFGGPPGTAQVAVDRAGRIVVDVADVSQRQLLVLTERFHQGWRALIDDHPGRTLPAYGDRLAVVLDPGARRVELNFAPGTLHWGAIVSALGILVVLATLFAAFDSPRPDDPVL